jgi:predicted ATPase
MISVTTEHNYPAWLASAKVLHGWALAATGAREAGIVQMHEGIAEHAALGVQQHRASLLGLLAGTYGRARRSDEALTRLAEVLAMAARLGEHWFEAELRRLRANVLFAGSPGQASNAESSLHSALAVAREQGAKWWELRAAMSMARLRRDQGKRDEARELLAPVYGWFTEGFDTLDLKQAKALLEELR